VREHPGATALWDFYNARHLFESSHSVASIFCFDVTRRTKRGVTMNETAGIALLYLMFGQFLILSFGILILWWMSEPGTRWTQSRAEQRAKAKEAALAGTEATVQPEAQAAGLPAESKAQPSTGDAFLTLARDRAVEPKLMKDRLEDDDAPAPSRDHAVQA